MYSLINTYTRDPQPSICPFFYSANTVCSMDTPYTHRFVQYVSANYTIMRYVHLYLCASIPTIFYMPYKMFFIKWQATHAPPLSHLGHCCCGAPSLTRGRVCLLYVLLALASVVFLGFESNGTWYHFLLSQIWDFPFRRFLGLAGSRWRCSTPPPHGSANSAVTSPGVIWRVSLRQVPAVPHSRHLIEEFCVAFPI
jgi:hypothetical protein